MTDSVCLGRGKADIRVLCGKGSHPSAGVSAAGCSITAAATDYNKVTDEQRRGESGSMQRPLLHFAPWLMLLASLSELNLIWMKAGTPQGGHKLSLHPGGLQMMLKLDK